MFVFKSFWFFLVLAITQNSYQTFGQNVIMGSVPSVPSNTAPDTTKITFTNTATGDKYAQRTVNGAFSQDLPSGTYQRKIEAKGNYLLLDTIVVNSSKVLNERIIKDKALTSQLYLNDHRSLLFLLKNLTSTKDGFVSTVLSRARNPPLRLFADRSNIPSGLSGYLDNALSDFTTKTSGIVSFRECPTDSIVGITLAYRNNSQYPFNSYPSTGWTDMDNNHPVCYFNTDYMNSSIALSAFLRELYRALNMFTNSADLNMVSYNSSNFWLGLHADEAEVIKRVFTLDNGTDMKKHRDVVVTSIPNVLPQSISFSNPSNNSTIAFVNGKLEVGYNSLNSRDGDGETQRVVIKLQGNGLDQYVTGTNTNGSILVDQALFQSDKQYILKGMTISGFDTIFAINQITFKTPITTGTEDKLVEMFVVYPNPVHNILTINGNNMGLINLQLTNMTGLFSFQKSFTATGQFSFQVDLSRHDNGTYFLKLKTDHDSRVFKIIKQ